MDLLPYERSTALGLRGAHLHHRMGQLLAEVPDGALTAAEVGDVFLQLHAFRARSCATQHRLDGGEKLGAETSVDKVLLATAEQALFGLAGDGLLGEVLLGDDPASDEWRTGVLYSRAATIYGGSAEIQRNIIARRLLDLGRSR
jgi:alkylation response protein AidB-like acyl-CoA dehydrogenase